MCEVAPRSGMARRQPLFGHDFTDQPVAHGDAIDGELGVDFAIPGSAVGYFMHAPDLGGER